MNNINGKNMLECIYEHGKCLKYIIISDCVHIYQSRNVFLLIINCV